MIIHHYTTGKKTYKTYRAEVKAEMMPIIVKEFVRGGVRFYKTNTGKTIIASMLESKFGKITIKEVLV